ncbi:MAG: hypothetical protein RL701_5898 [Pseudomonadota bacterium]|jgi:hypothetical protein
MSSLQNPEMNLLFATRFSEACFQAIRGVAQWMDDVSSSLTILHMYDPRKTNELDAEAQLYSFFAEADRYRHTRRVLVAGSDAGRTIADYLKTHSYDMVISPKTDRVGLPRPLHRSTRARLLAATQSTLWTMGQAMDHRRFMRPRRVGCVISRQSDSYRPLELACEYALRTGATLQLMYLVPEVHEGMLRNALCFNEPLTEAVAIEDLQRIAALLPVTPELHVTLGTDTSSVMRLLDRARTDVLFAGKQQATQSVLWLPEMQPFVDQAKCPVVCVDHDRSLPGWALALPQSREDSRRLVATA